MSKLPPVREGGRFGGRQSGRKCGDVDDYLSDHGSALIPWSAINPRTLNPGTTVIGK